MLFMNLLISNKVSTMHKTNESMITLILCSMSQEKAIQHIAKAVTNRDVEIKRLKEEVASLKKT